MSEQARSEIDVRRVKPGERRAALDVFRRSQHARASTSADWSVLSKSVEAEDTYAAFMDEKLIGMCNTFSTDVIVPGGVRLSAGAIVRLGVRADYTRRGVGRRLMTAALMNTSTPVMILRASEGNLYRRYGFGVSTRIQDLTVDARRAVVNPEVPDDGSVRLLALEEVAGIVGEICGRARDRPGSIARPSYYDDLYQYETAGAGLDVMTAVHRGPAGDDAYARYQVRRLGGDGPSARTVLEVDEMHSDSRDAWAALWRFLVGVPLIDQVTVRSRPMDEPVNLLFTDPRVCRVDHVTDELWLRLTDVLTALQHRQYADGDDLIIDVKDPVLERNQATYRIGADGVDPCAEAAQLSLGVDALACAYLGDVSFSALAAAGRVVVHTEAAIAVADHRFAIGQAPWCGTYI